MQNFVGKTKFIAGYMKVANNSKDISDVTYCYQYGD